MGKGSKKNKKDKDAPKKAISAYFFYIKERRDSITKELPNLNNKEIVKKMSEEWNALRDDKKKPYVQKALEDKKRYEKEKADYDDKKKKDEKPSKKTTKKGKKESDNDEEE
jgi:structure-specific recognition protein 1